MRASATFSAARFSACSSCWMPCDWLAMAAAAAAAPFPFRPVPSLPPRRRRQRHCVRPGPASTAPAPPPTVRLRPNPASGAPAPPPPAGAGPGPVPAVRAPFPAAGAGQRRAPPAPTEVSEGRLRPLPENKLKMRREPPSAPFRKAREGIWFYLLHVPYSLASQQTPNARCR